MKYQGQEIKEIDTSTTQIFDPPKKMLVWDASSGVDMHKARVCGILSNRIKSFRVLTESGAYEHCAEIPEQKLATYSEVSQWLAKGNGYMQNTHYSNILTDLPYDEALSDEPICDFALVRKWKDTEWHKPTREYLGLEG